MQIDELLKKQANNVQTFESSYLNAMKLLLLKQGFRGTRDQVHELIRKNVPDHIKGALQLGMDWLNEGKA